MFEKLVIIDGKGHMLGRLASVVAKEALNGQKIVVVRAEKIHISGSFFRNRLKFEDFLNKKHCTKPSRAGPFHFRAPSRFFWRVVRGMLPRKTQRGAAALGKTHLEPKLTGFYSGPVHLQKKHCLIVDWTNGVSCLVFSPSQLFGSSKGSQLEFFVFGDGDMMISKEQPESRSSKEFPTHTPTKREDASHRLSRSWDSRTSERTACSEISAHQSDGATEAWSRNSKPRDKREPRPTTSKKSTDWRLPKRDQLDSQKSRKSEQSCPSWDIKMGLERKKTI